MDTDKGNGGGTAFEGGAVVQDGRGRFRAGADLTDKQAAYVAAYLANGGKRKLAAISAEYAFPEVAACQLMRNPAVLQAIREGREEMITGEMSSIAMGTLKQIMLDTAAPPAARVAAAKWTLEAAGHGVAAQALQLRAGLDPRDKPMSEWTLADLEAMVSQKEAEVNGLIANKAQVIEA